MAELTPGEVAYTAFWQVQRKGGHHHWPPPFAQLPALTRQAWEAAAQAVLAMREEAIRGSTAHRARPVP